jgi:hypothetical protein
VEVECSHDEYQRAWGSTTLVLIGLSGEKKSCGIDSKEGRYDAKEMETFCRVRHSVTFDPAGVFVQARWAYDGAVIIDTETCDKHPSPSPQTFPSGLPARKPPPSDAAADAPSDAGARKK